MIEKQIAQPKAIGRELQKTGWVQTDKRAHEAWARFTLQKPTASALLHYMCAYMADQDSSGDRPGHAGKAPGRLNSHGGNGNL